MVGCEGKRRVAAESVKRRQLGLVLGGATPAPLGFRREHILYDGAKVGMMTDCVWSPRLKANIGYALIAAAVPVGAAVEVMRERGAVAARLVELPFI